MCKPRVYVTGLKCDECGEHEKIFDDGLLTYCGGCGLVLHDHSTMRSIVDDMEIQQQKSLEADHEYYQYLLNSFHGNHTPNQ